MNDIQPEQSNPGEASATSSADAAVSAMGAAIANRNAVLKSFSERRDQIFKVLEAQREEALKPMLHSKELLQQAHESIGLANQHGPALTQHDKNNASKPEPADLRQRLCRTILNALTVLLALQGAGGSAADAAREQAVTAIADLLVELIETEVGRLMHC